MTTKGRKTRKTRVPFGGPRMKLHIDVTDNEKLRGYHLCWVNEPKLDEYRAADYTFVTREELGQTEIGQADIGHGNTDVGAHVSRVVGRDITGEFMRAYLMKLPNHLHQQDLDAQEAENRKIDEAISGGSSGVERGYRKSDHRLTVGSKS